MTIRTGCSRTPVGSGVTHAIGGVMILALITSGLAISAPADADTGCPADASQSDCYFLTQVHQAVPLTQNIADTTVIARGHQLCAEMEAEAVTSGPATARRHEYNKFLEQSGLGDQVVSMTLQYSIAAYCPDINGASPNPINAIPSRPGTNSNVPLLCDGIEAASLQCTGYTNLPVPAGPQLHSNVPITCTGPESFSDQCAGN